MSNPSELIPLRETAAPAAGSDLHEPFTPLCERAVRSDGTIGIKIIGPGWGSSGYYTSDVLRRDIPRVFPVGTQMFWNHATATEEAERPEGDLNHLAGVTVSSPYWLESGAKGPGMYADARPFGAYAGAIDEIGDHIGVSIRALGRHTLGEAEGRQGRIIQELVAGKSVDFVTVPGAGGAIVKVFESAGNGRLPAPGVAVFLAEAGRVLSAANEKKLRAALEQLAAVLQLLDQGQTSEAARAATAQINEALSNNALRDRLHEQLKARFGGPAVWVWPQDWNENDGWVVFEMSSASETAVYQLGMTVSETDVQLAAETPTRVQAVVRYVPVSAATSESGRPEAANNQMEADMELNEALTALDEAQKAIVERDAAIARMQEQLLLREAREFVESRLTAAELPDVTKARLSRQLALNPPIKDGRVDEAILTQRVETAVTEAQTEIAAIAGNGSITGMGSAPATGGVPALEESRKRTEAALARLGGM